MRSLHAIFPAAVVGCLLAAPAAFAAADPEDKAVNLSPDASAAKGGAESAGGGSILRTIVSLAIVLGVIYSLYWVLKKVKASKDSTASGAGLESLAMLPLGTGRALHLVRAGSEIVLVGTAEHSVTPIRRYSETEARALGLLETPVPPGATLASLQPQVPKGFLDHLRSKTVVNK